MLFIGVSGGYSPGADVATVDAVNCEERGSGEEDRRLVRGEAVPTVAAVE